MTGVLRDVTHGRPVGSIEVTQTVFSSAELSAELSRSTEELCQSQTGEWFKVAVKKVGIKVQSQGEGDNEHHVLKGEAASSASAKKKAKKADTTVDDFDSLLDFWRAGGY